MTSILQLSDPHFGTERSEAMRALKLLCDELHPDLLLVTGDVTQRARRAEFGRARDYFDSLGLSARLVIPGNHDIPLYDVLSRVFDPYGRFTRGLVAAVEGEFESDDVLVMALDTTRRYRHKQGEVSTAQIERVALRMARAAPGQLRLVAVHQPVAAVTGADLDNLLRGHERAVRRWAEVGVDAVLGGHIHLPYVLPLHSAWPGLHRRMWAIQAGTALSARVRGGVSNSVNLIRAGATRSAEVQRWDLDARMEAFRLVETTRLA